jgi:hypothetical protein
MKLYKNNNPKKAFIMKKYIFLILGLLPYSLQSIKIQSTVNGTPNGRSIELTQEQYDACVASCNFFKALQQWPNNHWAPHEDIISIPCYRTQLSDLLYVVKNGPKALKKFNAHRLIGLIQIADYVGLQDEEIKIACAQQLLDVINQFSWLQYEQYLPLIDVFFTQSQGAHVIKEKLGYFEQRTFEEREVYTISWSPDGSKIVLGKLDSTILIFDFEKDECINGFLEHQGLVSSVDWSSDGTKIVSGSWDHTIKIWNPDGSECAGTLEGHDNLVTSVQWSPDSKKIVSGSADHTIKIWNGLTGEIERTLVGHQKNVSSVSWSSDGSKILSSSWDHTIKIWDARTGKCIDTLRGHTGEVCSACWSSNDTQILSTSCDESIRLWDTHTKTCIFVQQFDGVITNPVADCSSCNSRIASCYDERTVTIWKHHTETTQKLSDLLDIPRLIKWSTDGNKLAYSSSLDVSLWLQLDVKQALFVVRAQNGGINRDILQHHEYVHEIYNSLPENVKNKLSLK